MKLIVPPVLLLFLHLSQAVPLRLQKRAASFYIANDTACVVDSTVYLSGDPIPTDDPCEACRCRPPGFACVLKECQKKPGCRAIRRTGHCCPDYICGCEHNGRMYRDGDEIRDAKNPCYTCHCQGSSIACAFVDCFFRVDCAPEYVPGECCPRYDHCATTIDSDNVTARNPQPTEINARSGFTTTLAPFPAETSARAETTTGAVEKASEKDETEASGTPESTSPVFLHSETDADLPKEEETSPQPEATGTPTSQDQEASSGDRTTVPDPQSVSDDSATEPLKAGEFEVMRDDGSELASVSEPAPPDHPGSESFPTTRSPPADDGPAAPTDTDMEDGGPTAAVTEPDDKENDIAKKFRSLQDLGPVLEAKEHVEGDKIEKVRLSDADLEEAKTDDPVLKGLTEESQDAYHTITRASTEPHVVYYHHDHDEEHHTETVETVTVVVDVRDTSPSHADEPSIPQEANGTTTAVQGPILHSAAETSPEVKQGPGGVATTEDPTSHRTEESPEKTTDTRTSGHGVSTTVPEKTVTPEVIVINVNVTASAEGNTENTEGSTV